MRMPVRSKKGHAVATSPIRLRPAGPARAACVLGSALGLALLLAAAPAGAGAALATAPVQASRAAPRGGYDGVVEAVRQTALAAPVAGAVVALDVAAGDRVRAGQTIARVDARAAVQTAAAGQAQVRAAEAALDIAQREVERQRQLRDAGFVSVAALDRAEAQARAAAAEVAAQRAQAGAAATQTGLHVVRAPYDGVVAEVPVALGDMALPGRPLAVVYDPKALRVSVAVPHAALPATPQPADVQLELAGHAAPLVPRRVERLPAIDPRSHTVVLRAELPAVPAGVSPGQFARVTLPVTAAFDGVRLSLPASAVVRRAELHGVYVVGAGGRPQLRLVRLGPRHGDGVEVLAGVAEGERVALDPQAAARAARP